MSIHNSGGTVIPDALPGLHIFYTQTKSGRAFHINHVEHQSPNATEDVSKNPNKAVALLIF